MCNVGGMSKPVFIAQKSLADDTIVAEHFAGDGNWFELIKALRATYDITIYDAEKMVLSHAGWRRWCNKRIKSNPQCRVYAWKHLRQHGEASLIKSDGANLEVCNGSKADIRNSG